MSVPGEDEPEERNSGEDKIGQGKREKRILEKGIPKKANQYERQK